MDFCTGLRVLLICGLSVVVYCEEIDYRKAEQIFQELHSDTKELKNDPQSRSLFPESELQFITFMRDYDRVYDSKEELFQRLANFVAHVEMVQVLTLADRGTARYGINKFSDLSAEELQRMTGFRGNHREDSEASLQESQTEDNRTAAEKQAIQNILNRKENEPTSLDWRDKGVISKVKNQKLCQCCWAFSAVGVVEAMNAIVNEALVELSAQQLVDCDKSNGGCVDGGYMHKAYDYMIRDGGVESEQDYPFKGKESPEGCKASAGDGKTKYGLDSYTEIPKRDEEQMKAWVAQHGPLSVGMNADGLDSYESGIIDLDEEQCSPEGLNHALIVIGYGEEEKDGKTIPYWIVRNSWAETWGEEGYFRIKRGANMCGISEYVHGVQVKREKEAEVNEKPDENVSLWDLLDC